ncbi:MAG: ribonucleotide-diphosphate reductase subunit beta, partial [Candidatus Didemnitutus sp.]|nr:ribonucleotide-diphosphate reductase subunit beta [Candidatus Didemnitutus sp.]
MLKTFQVGTKSFVLDQAKAEAAFAAKMVINGRQVPYFNILPLKYQWAYDLYKKMKANHWEPEDIPMGKDIEQWRDTAAVSDIERWIIRMGIGYFSAAEGIVGDNVQHVVREIVTAPELKLVLGRHAHEENIHADSLLYMISSLGINPHECEAMFEDIKSIERKNEFVNRASQALRRDLDMTDPANKRLLAKNIFIFGQCMEGTQFYGLFGMVLALYRQNKFPGIGQMFRYTLRDESNHIELFRDLFMDLVEENREIWTAEFKEELRQTMVEAVNLEKD